MFSSAVHYKNQDYAVLKNVCIQTKTLFEDPEFPANNRSVYDKVPPPGRVEWKRPGEICKDPQFFVEGISSHDLNQGEIGNCWFVAACSCLALKPNLWEKVIPDWKEQEWDPKRLEKYAGIFHFQFWIFGQWTDVVIDDRLPTINGKLIYCQSKQNNEFWSTLLEKAYAKLAGCYEHLIGGNTGDAVVDFSGAVAEAIDLTKEKFYTDKAKEETFFGDLLKVWNRGGVISCSIKAEPHEIENKMENGLIKGHAYAVTDVKEVRLGQGLMAFFKNETIPLIRMRNPWGKTEWKGAWSDSSEEWSKVGDKERSNLGITVKDDGEFWMSFTDWSKAFTDADVCRIINTSLISIHKTWNEVVHFGHWTKQSDPLLNRCGGCTNNRETFLQNPQYLFDVTKESDEVLISLQQKNQRQKGEENQSIGFSILKVELNRKYRMHKILTQEIQHTSTYINARSVFKRCELPKGRYMVIPTTFDRFKLGDFMLRLFTDEDSGCRELVKDKPGVACWTSFVGYPLAVTHVFVKAAEIGHNGEQEGGIHPYVIVSSEGRSVQSAVKKETSKPDFDTGAVFYRKKITKPLTVQVWSSHLGSDKFLGQVMLSGSLTDNPNFEQLQLKKRGSDKAEDMPGKIVLRIITAEDLTAI